MTNAFSRSPNMRPVSVGYLVTLGFAMSGIVFVAIGLGGVFEARAGRDPMDAINLAGLPAFLFTWFLLYFFRLIFWRKVPERRQAQARAFLTTVLVVEVFSAMLAILLLFPNAGGVEVALAALGAIFQIATVTWLVRYRHE